MRAGTLNRRVTIQKLTTALDEYGEPTGPSIWVDVATVFSSVKHASGLETVKSGLNVSVVSTSIRIRYRDDVTAGMRVVYGQMIWDVRAVMPDVNRREHCDLVCQIGQNQG